MKLKNKLRTAWREIKFRFWTIFGGSFTARVCKHRTKLHTKEIVFGQTIYCKVSRKHDYCAKCLAAMSIKCAWCGDPIMIGELITLYKPTAEFKIPEYATRWDKDPEFLVGCLGWHCAGSGADRAGFWVIPGKIRRVVSPEELAIATGDVVICNDLADINKAIPYPEDNPT